MSLTIVVLTRLHVRTQPYVTKQLNLFKEFEGSKRLSNFLDTRACGLGLRSGAMQVKVNLGRQGTLRQARLVF